MTCLFHLLLSKAQFIGDTRLKFAIEGNGGLFIKKIDGCFSNVIGLSLPWLKTNLEKCGLSGLLLDRKN